MSYSKYNPTTDETATKAEIIKHLVANWKAGYLPRQIRKLLGVQNPAKTAAGDDEPTEEAT